MTPAALRTTRRARPKLVAVQPGSRPRRILVLGAGFMGAHIARVLSDAGHQVDVITRSAPRVDLASYLDGANVVLSDLVAAPPPAALIAEADHIVYAVAASSPAESARDPGSDVGLVVTPVVRLLESLRMRPSVGLTYLSSGGAVYGQVSGVATEETTPLPISSYGILKRTVEHYLRMYGSLYGVSVRILRVGNAYGPGQAARGQGLIAHLLHSMASQAPFVVYGTGDNIRDYVHVDDVAAAVVQLIGSEAPFQTYNLGSGVGNSIIDVIGALEAVSGRRVDIDFRETRPFDVGSIVLDVSRLRSVINYAPRDLHTGLVDTWLSCPASRGGSAIVAAPLEMAGAAG